MPGETAEADLKTMESFGITRVNRLRNAAARARQMPDEEFPGFGLHVYEFAEGWFRSPVNPGKFLSVFEALRQSVECVA